MTNLAEKYRPQSFDDFKGSELVAGMIEKLVLSGSLPNCMLFSGPKGTGKRLEINTPVLTPTGWVPIKDLTEGDEVIGSNGLATKVTYASPPVSRPLYEICFSDGASVLADPDHLWEVRNQKGRSSVKTTQEIVDHWERVGYLPVYSVPTVEPVQFPEASLDIHPYMMGSLLADGYLKTPQIQWTKNDEGVIRLMAESASLGGWSLQERTRSGSRQWAFRHISDPFKEYHDRSFLATALQELGLLGKGSADKFIPEQYFTASETQRRDLLTGLFDGDGRLSSKGTPVYHSTSHQLAIDVRNLCWSLGMGAHLQAQKPDGTWPVLITSSHNPFRGALHVPTLKERVYRRRIVDIVPKETGMGRCISVDSEDHLYVTKDYIVTHNTSMARIISRRMNGDDSGFSYIEIDAASNNGIDEIRKLQETVRYSHGGTWRLVVLDEAHNLSSAAFNALLKVLEEPPAKTTFILSTTHPESLPDTVHSRAMRYRFQPIPIPTIARRLAEVALKEGINIPDAKVIIGIAEVSEGSMRTALVTLDQLQQIDKPTVEDVEVLSGHTVSAQDIMYAMLSGELSQVESELSNAFASTCDVDVLLRSLMDTLKKFHKSNLISNTQFLTSVTVVWNMRKLQRSNDRVSRTQLEAGLYAMFVQSYWNGEDEKTVTGAKAISAQDLEALSR